MGLVQTAESAHLEMEGRGGCDQSGGSKWTELRAGTKVHPETFSISSFPFSFFLYADHVDNDGQSA